MSKYYWCISNQSFHITNLFRTHMDFLWNFKNCRKGKNWEAHTNDKAIPRFIHCSVRCARRASRALVLFIRLIILVIANSFEIHSFIRCGGILLLLLCSDCLANINVQSHVNGKGCGHTICSVRRANRGYYTLCPRTQNSSFFSYSLISFLFSFFTSSLSMHGLADIRSLRARTRTRTRTFEMFVYVRWVSLMDAGGVTERN